MNYIQPGQPESYCQILEEHHLVVAGQKDWKLWRP